MFDPIEAEINAIRLQIYEEIKDMTPEEEARYFINSARTLAILIVR